jgi:hypothetical protein
MDSISAPGRVGDSGSTNFTEIIVLSKMLWAFLLEADKFKGEN